MPSTCWGFVLCVKCSERRVPGSDAGRRAHNPPRHFLPRTKASSEYHTNKDNMVYCSKLYRAPILSFLPYTHALHFGNVSDCPFNPSSKSLSLSSLGNTKSSTNLNGALASSICSLIYKVLKPIFLTDIDTIIFPNITANDGQISKSDTSLLAFINA